MEGLNKKDRCLKIFYRPEKSAGVSHKDRDKQNIPRGGESSRVKVRRWVEVGTAGCSRSNRRAGG